MAFLAAAVASGGFGIYTIIEVAWGRQSVWTLAMLPAVVALAAFCWVIAYAGIYHLVTGRRWPGADRIGRVAERLNSNL